MPKKRTHGPSGFSPSADQKRWLRVTIELGWNAPVTERCTSSGVSERTVRKWREDPPFTAWIDQAYWTHMQRTGTLTSVYSAILGAALAGRMRAAHMFLLRFDPDYVPSERSARMKDAQEKKEAVKRLLALAAEHGVPCEKVETG